VIKSVSFSEDVEKCDFILTGISTSLIEVIVQGKACLFCKELDQNHVEKYGDVEAGLTMYWRRDVNIDDINRQFQNINREQINQRLDLNRTLVESIEQLNNLIFNT